MAKEESFPEVGDLVVCTVHNVKNFGAFVLLDEFPSAAGKAKLESREAARGRGDETSSRQIQFTNEDFLEGFIHVAEVATGWIKYIRDYVREGQKVVCKVIKVDRGKRHIDLSLKTVNEHQKREKVQEWKNEQKAQKLLEIVGEKLGTPAEDLMESWGHELVETFGTLYRAFEECSLDDQALAHEGVQGDWTNAFIEVAKENIIPPFVTIDGFLELTSLQPDGAQRIREALMQVGKEDTVTVTVQYLGAPRYRVVVRAPDYKLAEEEIRTAAERALKHLQSHGGEGKFIREG